MQRVHWDPEFARRSGNPTTFDYGRMRETWLIHLCTDWMGDDAWLWKLDCEFRRFNYVGDTQWLRGTVTRKYLAEGDRPAVDLDLVAENQRGEVTTPGHATILLPSREHGAGAPARPAGRRHRPAAARSTPSPRGSPTAPPGAPGDRGRPVRARSTARRRARRRRAAAHARPPDKRNALDDDDDGGASSTPSTPPGGTSGSGRRAQRARATTSAAAPTSWPATPAGATAPPARASAASSAGCRRTAHRLIPLLLDSADPGRVPRAGLGRRHRASTSRWPPTSPWPPTDARFWEPFTERGFTPDSGGTWLLPRLVGMVRARELLLLGRELPGAEAADWGLIHPAVPAESSTTRSSALVEPARRRAHRRARAHQVAAAHAARPQPSSAHCRTRPSPWSCRRAARTSARAWPPSARSATPSSEAAD